MPQNKEKLVEVLHNIGLTENESKVYFASLSLGPSTVLAIARRAEVKRTTVYSVIESLKMKGLMAEELMGLKTIFVASSPDKLDTVLAEQKEILSKNLPDLMTLFSLQESEATLRYYEGLEAVKEVYEGLLRDVKLRDFYCVVADMARWFELDPAYFAKFVERRAKLNIDIRLLFTNSPKARESKQFERNWNQKVKILPEGTQLTTSLIVTPQKVVIHQYNPISAIVIQTKGAILLQKEMFEIMWRAIP